jgi:NTP pyrophosphatase (non-canonical NTP hydrolase)
MEAKNIKDWGLYCKVLKKFGDEAQMGMLTEECAELIQANSKLSRARAGSGDEGDCLENFIEEMADVQIMIEQMLIMCENQYGGAFEMFASKKAYKTERLSKDLIER